MLYYYSIYSYFGLTFIFTMLVFVLTLVIMLCALANFNKFFYLAVIYIYLCLSFSNFSILMYFISVNWEHLSFPSLISVIEN